MKRLSHSDLERAGVVSAQIEDLVAHLVNFDGLADRVVDNRGPEALNQLQHDMKLEIYRAARRVAEDADPVVDPPSSCHLTPSCNSLGMVCQYPQASCMKDPYDYS